MGTNTISLSTNISEELSKKLDHFLLHGQKSALVRELLKFTADELEKDNLFVAKLLAGHLELKVSLKVKGSSNE